MSICERTKLSPYPVVLAAFFCLSVAVINGVPAAQAAPPAAPPFPAACVAADNDPSWADPMTYRAVNGKTFLNLSMHFGEKPIQRNRVQHRSYNGNLVGPVCTSPVAHDCSLK